MQTIIHGGIYYIADAALTLPPDSERQLHQERRPFLVLSGPDTNADPDWTVVSGCPLSSSTVYRTHLDVKLAAGEGGVTKKCWVRIHAIQPILKEDLEDRVGSLDAVRLQEVQARLLQYLGLIATGKSGAAFARTESPFTCGVCAGSGLFLTREQRHRTPSGTSPRQRRRSFEGRGDQLTCWFRQLPSDLGGG